ncbi:DUF4230 domain-containing protein [Sphingomonas sp. PWP1-2]|uniref:DUF4230 domain-containing protein n=1 Tax=Sphingomonas sp. PWP1-2 TaxID=2804558 RepID=UPI003CF6E6D3
MIRVLKLISGLIVVAFAVVGVKLAYDRYIDDHTVSSDDSGYVIAQVVAAKLYGSSDLRVSRLRGTVQGVAVDARFFDLLRSQRIMKAPFQVGYFVDLSKISPNDFRYDPQRRILFVEAPSIRIEEPNIDETRISLDRTSGWFVTREAMIVLQRRASVSAARVATVEARKPGNVELAKQSARRALETLFSGSLSAARIDATVKIHFADEGRESPEVWDTTKSIAEVLANRS